MGRGILKLVIILLALLHAGYMSFDGAKAFSTGDYIRPSEGEYAGQLGPWTKLVTLVGIDPMSDLMKGIFLGLGLFGILGVLVFMFRPRIGYGMLLLFSILTLWNLIFGTVSSVILILLLLAWRRLYSVSYVAKNI